LGTFPLVEHFTNAYLSNRPSPQDYSGFLRISEEKTFHATAPSPGLVGTFPLVEDFANGSLSNRPFPKYY
jgi:hypothetical protein